LQTSSAHIPSIPSHRPRCCTTDLPDLAGLEPKGRRLVGLHPSAGRFSCSPPLAPWEMGPEVEVDRSCNRY
jgi:hypothetical protein